MTNIFNKVFYSKKPKTKTWVINGVETDPKQTDDDKDIKIKDAKIKLTLAKEQDNANIITTIEVNGQEYSFILYDEIIQYVSKIRGVKNDESNSIN